MGRAGLSGEGALWLRDPEAPALTCSIAELLRRRAAESRDHVALTWREGEGLGRMTYGEMLEAAEAAARWMLQHAEPGDRVAVWARNSWQWVISEYACAMAGLVIASWNTSWTDYEVTHALNLTDPRIVLAEADTRGVDLRERARALSGDRAVDNLADLSTKLRGDVSRPLPDPGPDAPFLIQFTSGTTGRAKGALHLQRTALNGGALRVADGGGAADDVFLNAAPMHHMGGSISLILGVLVAGGTFALMGRFEAGEQIRMIRDTGATRTGGVPTTMIAVLEHPDFPKEGFHMRGMGIGAADVPTTLIERMLEAFRAPVANTYGQSECPMISKTSPSDPVEMVVNSVGRPAPQNDVKIIDPATGKILGIGEVGEICARSPSQMHGYFAQPDATAQTIDADGWLHTGDLGSFDADGYLYVRGRARETIIRGGENIYPIEVETVLAQHPAVAAVAACGVPDEKWGHQVGAAIILREGMSATEGELDAFIRERLAHFKAPRHWMFVDAFPMTASGKVRRVELAERFAPAEARPATAP
jgi:fatty-acyl-CoA synthase